MQFESVKIRDFPPFKNFFLPFPPGVTVIAGLNGVGKSRLLNYLSHHIQSIPEELGGFGISLRSANGGGLINFSANRTLPKTSVTGLRPYSARHSNEMSLHDLSNIGAVFKEWFVNMDHFEHRNWIDRPQSIKNFNLCKKIFSLLDSDYRFLEVDRDLEVWIQTPSGPVPYDQTSSGFQSAYFLLFGIVFIIETTSQGQQEAEEFDGCILIDEIDVHLHPNWQNKILDLIQAIVPKAQIIATTHSPHVIQGLSRHQLVVLERNSVGHPEVRPVFPTPSIYGFQGWSVEEISRDVMGVKNDRSLLLISTVKAFKKAVRSKDVEAATPVFRKLMEMLHPENDLRVMYQMEFESIGGQA